MEKLLRTRLLTALVLAAVFSSGVLVGMAADRGAAVVETAAAGDSTARQGDGERERERERRRTPIYEQVQPTPEQRARIDSIVKEHRQRMDALQEEFRKAYRELRDAYDPRYQELIRDTREAIKAVLTPEQAEEYQRLLDEWDRRRAEREQRGERDER